MSVDYGVRMIYGFELDQKKFQEFVEKMEEENPEFGVYNWMEEVAEQSNCELVYENHYTDATSDYNTVFFGVPVYNRLTPAFASDIARVRFEEVCDELVRIFGSYDILGGIHVIEPEFIAVGGT